MYAFNALKRGEDVKLDDGRTIAFKEVTFHRPKSYSYAYCSDTAYLEKIIESIKGVDVLFHESTFTEELNDRAKETHHSTARQAATIAQKAEVGKLVLGHFSVRYKSTENFLAEASAVFPNTIAAEDGMVIRVY
jgi:ribonuclease Z